jgi:hypothetical protein
MRAPLRAGCAEIIFATDFGAANNNTDSSSDIQEAFNTSEPVLFTKGTFKTDTAITGSKRFISIGADFTGTNTLDPYPAFGEGTFKAFASGNNNAIIGIAHNTNSASTVSFPTGVTGYGRNDNGGNTVFGVYAEGRQYANTGCVVGAELNSFNHGAAPTNTTVPNRSIGTTQQLPNAITIGAGGTANSWCGTHYVPRGQFASEVFVWLNF